MLELAARPHQRLARAESGTVTGPRPGLLASVRSAEEALLACVVPGQVALVDAKEPRHGALGSLPSAVLHAIVQAVAGRAAVSATTGDLPLDAATLGPAMQRVAACGVDFVKIGIFGAPDPAALARCLADLPPVKGRIAVLMADQGGAGWPLHLFAEHGFAGVMLDTAHKQAGALPDLLTTDVLVDFVQRARALGLLCGLAGSLRLRDIAPLQAVQADYLGFRSALCGDAPRTATLQPQALAAVAQAMASAQTC